MILEFRYLVSIGDRIYLSKRSKAKVRKMSYEGGIPASLWSR